MNGTHSLTIFLPTTRRQHIFSLNCTHSVILKLHYRQHPSQTPSPGDSFRKKTAAGKTEHMLHQQFYTIKRKSIFVRFGETLKGLVSFLKKISCAMPNTTVHYNSSLVSSLDSNPGNYYQYQEQPLQFITQRPITVFVHLSLAVPHPAAQITYVVFISISTNLKYYNIPDKQLKLIKLLLLFLKNLQYFLYCINNGQ